MGLFDKEKLKSMANKAKEGIANSIDEAQKEAERKKELGLLNDITISKLEYKGGHPDLTKEKDCTLLISNDYLKITCGFIAEAVIPYKDITSIHLETQEQLGKRITATRLLTLGVFALAFKKKTKSSEQYFTIDFDDNGLSNTVVIGGKYAANAHSQCYRRFQNFLIRNPRIEQETVENSSTEPYEELKKVKELLDMGIISQEEFDAKKKDLLGL